MRAVHSLHWIFQTFFIRRPRIRCMLQSLLCCGCQRPLNQQLSIANKKYPVHTRCEQNSLTAIQIHFRCCVNIDQFPAPACSTMASLNQLAKTRISAISVMESPTRQGIEIFAVYKKVIAYAINIQLYKRQKDIKRSTYHRQRQQSSGHVLLIGQLT
jgi:hypothetical protein